MKRRLRAAAVALALLVALAQSAVRADEGDTARLELASSLIGQHSLLVLDVAIPAGASIEVDPAAASWNGVEVVAIERNESRASGAGAIAHLELSIAPFLPGRQQFAPAVNVIENGTVTARELPPVEWTVVATLRPTDPAEISPIAPPVAIDGAESPLLRPAIVLGVVAGTAVLVVLVLLAARAIQRRPRPLVVVPEAEAAPPDLGAAEELLGHDPVAAYRAMALTVRGAVATRYGLPAHALTTIEIRRRMEAAGVDRFQARLVGGLLEECDAVIYAGYRPASERRYADLTMAREILEGAA